MKCDIILWKYFAVLKGAYETPIKETKNERAKERESKSFIKIKYQNKYV